jgi:uncharacterized protein YdiU (UPF0061 family)
MQINLVTFARTLVVLAPDDDELHERMQEVVGKEYGENVYKAMTHMQRRKLGLVESNIKVVSNEEVEALWVETLQLMFDVRADWTLFWRLLSSLAELPASECSSQPLWASLYPPTPSASEDLGDDSSDEREADAVHEPSDEVKAKLNALVQKWRALEPNAQVMKEANPKYVLREWMLVDAYSAAQCGDFTVVKELEALMANPYADGCGSSDSVAHELERKYFRRTPPAMQDRGGVSFFS